MIVVCDFDIGSAVSGTRTRDLPITFPTLHKNSPTKPDLALVLYGQPNCTLEETLGNILLVLVSSAIPMATRVVNTRCNSPYNGANCQAGSSGSGAFAEIIAETRQFVDAA